MSIATLANQSWSLDAHVWCVGQYARIKSGSMCLCGTSVKHSGRALGVSRVERQTPAKVCPAAQCECFKMESLSESKCASPERLPIFQILSGANEDGHLTLTHTPVDDANADGAKYLRPGASFAAYSRLTECERTEVLRCGFHVGSSWTRRKDRFTKDRAGKAELRLTPGGHLFKKQTMVCMQAHGHQDCSGV